MSLFVSTNMSSINATRQLFTSNNNLNTAFERLSSGFRINGAKDDAAGLQISNRITTQVLGLHQAVRNPIDGISLLQTIEGALAKTTSALQRMRVLAVQSQNVINSSAGRVALQKEITALKDEISRIGFTSQFDGVDVLDGAFSSAFLVGANAGQTFSVNVERTWGYGVSGIFVASISVLTESEASAAMASISEAVTIIYAQRADLGAIQNRIQSTIRNLSHISENVSAARSCIRNTDFAVETAELTRWQIIQQVSLTVLGQANQRPQAALQLLG
jgi:flagellin